ncbi:ribosome small subunit-dependent GTPase A [Clostridiales bacterium F-3ap]|uniref:Small ribosomal subunit biogenesis GTPase RsgA n=1 Tax=Anaerotalea alkaliphila TaxID=2662126 RepID=A0A7X5HTW5_9FIRM|nr:ribosome small subunit-dependent GTPase A [Anaerotalea alkaliphila]
MGDGCDTEGPTAFCNACGHAWYGEGEEGLHPGRVVSQYKDLYKVAVGNAEVLAEISGKLRHGAQSRRDYPAVGDHVLVDRTDDAGGHAIIHRILPRTSAFVRKDPGNAGEVQVVAANIDTVFLCMSLNRDFNLRRLERYLAIAWDSGATPVVVLTKADLCPEWEERMEEVRRTAPGVEVVLTSSFREEGWKPLAPYLGEGRTAAFLGSSGVGKSTMINRLLGEERIRTKAVREDDDRGRHATTRRELFLIPGGGAVIDTPGMRELGLESADLDRTFEEVQALAEQCRFKDCTHQDEPGCAVRRAVEEGELSRERLESWRKLKKEAKYDGLNARQIEQEKVRTMFAGFGGVKNARNYIKGKNKRK